MFYNPVLETPGVYMTAMLLSFNDPEITGKTEAKLLLKASRTPTAAHSVHLKLYQWSLIVWLDPESEGACLAVDQSAAEICEYTGGKSS